MSYYITGGSGYGYYELGISHGNISTSFALSGVEGSELHLFITAVDKSSLSYSYDLLVLLLGDIHAVPEVLSPTMVVSAPEDFQLEGMSSEWFSQFVRLWRLAMPTALSATPLRTAMRRANLPSMPPLEL